MSDTRQRLIRCFQAVFPNLSEAEAARATALNVSEWDSLATAILVAAIEEEFGVGFAPEDIESLQSFEESFAQLRRGDHRVNGGAATIFGGRESGESIAGVRAGS